MEPTAGAIQVGVGEHLPFMTVSISAWRLTPMTFSNAVLIADMHVDPCGVLVNIWRPFVGSTRFKDTYALIWSWSMTSVMFKSLDGVHSFVGSANFSWKTSAAAAMAARLYNNSSRSFVNIWMDSSWFHLKTLVRTTTAEWRRKSSTDGIVRRELCWAAGDRCREQFEVDNVDHGDGVTLWGRVGVLLVLDVGRWCWCRVMGRREIEGEENRFCVYGRGEVRGTETCWRSWLWGEE